MKPTYPSFLSVEIMALRLRYTKEEDECILAFVRKKHIDQVSGNSIWREAEFLQVTV